MKAKNKSMIPKEVQRTIEKYKMLKETKKMIIAFSSGPDSVCLLDVLYNLYGKKFEFHLVYVNHGLRPKRVLKSEENLTKKYAVKYHVNYEIINVKVKKKKIGVEATAREERYNALLNYMRKIDAQRIAFGHNLDDVLETFFMNLLRGSGTKGLKSIPPVRAPFIRPLINVKKESILNYLKRRKLRYSLDETNIRLNYRRNLLRQQVIPQLAKINPNIHETIKREINILRQDDEYFEKQAKKIYAHLATKEKSYISLDLKGILRYNLAVISRVVMKAVKDLHGNLNGFESKHFDEIVGLKDKKSGKKINLPKGLYAQREYENIVIGYAKIATSIRRILDTESEVLIPENIIVRTRVVPRFDMRKKSQNCEVFDLNKINRPLFISNKQRGDIIELKIGKKKIKKVFNEFRIPIHKRDKIMMLCDQKGILWIFGILRTFRGFISKRTKKILVVDFEYIN